MRLAHAVALSVVAQRPDERVTPVEGYREAEAVDGGNRRVVERAQQVAGDRVEQVRLADVLTVGVGFVT